MRNYIENHVADLQCCSSKPSPFLYVHFSCAYYYLLYMQSEFNIFVLISYACNAFCIYMDKKLIYPNLQTLGIATRQQRFHFLI